MPLLMSLSMRSSTGGAICLVLCHAAGTGAEFGDRRTQRRPGRGKLLPPLPAACRRRRSRSRRCCCRRWSRGCTLIPFVPGQAQRDKEEMGQELEASEEARRELQRQVGKLEG